MQVSIDNEYVRWGESPTSWVNFLSLIEKAEFDGNGITVKCKYGEYTINPDTQKVATLSGIDYYILDEVAKYGMGYKYWERGV